MQNWEPLNANETHTHHQQVQIWFFVDKWLWILDFHDFFWKLIGKLFKLESYRFDTCKTENLSTQTRSRRITTNCKVISFCWQVIMNFGLSRFFGKLIWKLFKLESYIPIRYISTCKTENLSTQTRSIRITTKCKVHNLILCWQVIYENFTPILHKYSFSRSVMM